MRVHKAFTYLEIIFVLGIISILLFIQTQFLHGNINENQMHQHKLKNIIAHFTYLKSQAIRNQHYVSVIFDKYSNKIKIMELEHQHSPIKLGQDSYIHPRTNLNYVSFDKRGHVNKFGSLYISIQNKLYRIIFHIEKGRMRYEKVKM